MPKEFKNTGKSDAAAPIRRNAMSAAVLALLVLAAVPLWTGCASTANGRQPLFDPSGRHLFNPDYKCPLTDPEYKCPLTDPNYQCPLSGKRDKGSKQLPVSKEPKAQEGGAPNACEISPWQNVSADSSSVITPRDTDRWTAQLPNGGVLFPRYLDAAGPKVVMEPRTIIAQVGTEVVMVASYIGEGNEYLQTGQKLEWNLDGTGHFLTSNPANGCLNFDSTMTKRISSKQMFTSTSAKLWRIHRGTSTPLDDITILRGQSWATVQSAEEGTTAVSVYAQNIDNWGNRTASGQIHWIDAMFRFPTSTVSPVGQTVDLTTTVYRKTVVEPRSGWIVRYQVLSGPPAGFGANGDQTVEVETNQYGQATVPFTQTSGGPGANNIKVQVIRPAGDGMERAVVDEKTITQLWSGDAIFNLGIKGSSQQGRIGDRLSYEMEVSNLSALPQDAVVRLPLPAGTRIAASNPAVSGYEGRTAVWELSGLPARSRQLIAFDLDVDTDGIITLDARVDQRGAAYTTPTDPAPSAPPAGDYASPIRIPDSPPAPTESAPTQAAPADAASTAPSLDNTVPPPPADSTNHIVLEADMFPSSVSRGKEFNGRVRVTKTGETPKTALSLILPDGVYFLEKDGNGQTVNRYTGNPEPIVFNDFNFDEDYAFFFTADRLGQKDIRIRVINRETNEVIVRKEIMVEVVP